MKLPAFRKHIDNLHFSVFPRHVCCRTQIKRLCFTTFFR